MHLEAAHIDAARKHRPVGPEAAEALAVLQGCGTAETGPIERQVAVAGHPVEKRRIREFRLIEAGDAAELDARECRDAAEARVREASIVEKDRTRDVDRGVEGGSR